MLAIITPIKESLLSNLMHLFPESLKSLFPLKATSIKLFFLEKPDFVAKTINLFFQLTSSFGSGKKVAIFSPFIQW